MICILAQHITNWVVVKKMYRVAQNKPDYSTFQPSSRKVA